MPISRAGLVETWLLSHLQQFYINWLICAKKSTFEKVPKIDLEEEDSEISFCIPLLEAINKF